MVLLLCVRKTTILSCMIGLRRLDSGIVRIFGKQPGDPDSGIPGKVLGYMPQVNRKTIHIDKMFCMCTLLITPKLFCINRRSLYFKLSKLKRFSHISADYME